MLKIFGGHGPLAKRMGVTQEIACHLFIYATSEATHRISE